MISLLLTCNKAETLDSMQCYINSPSYSIYESLFDEIMEENRDILQPFAYYVMTENQVINNNELYEQIVCCAITLGAEVDRKMQNYFEVDDYMKGILLSSIADNVLFHASKELYQLIYNDVRKQNMMLTKRIEPGTSSLPITAQSWVLESIKEQEAVALTLTSGYMLNPTKSMAYCYGAGRNLIYTPIDHDCSQCDHVHCIHRKINVTIQKLGEVDRVYSVKNGSNLLTVLREVGEPIHANCSGNGTCGKCKVRIVSPKLPISMNERQMITTDEIEQGYVLACYQNLVTNIVVEIEEQNAEILSDFDIPKVKENKYSWIRIDGLKKRPEDSESAVDLIAHHLGKDYNYSLSALRKLSNLFNQQPFEILERDERHVSDLRKESGSFYGIGIDIGTTTLALALIDLEHKQVCSVYKCMNPQKVYGADVISRIHYTSNHTDSSLRDVIQNSVLVGIRELLDKYQVQADDIMEVAVVGNTVMQYLFAGINPCSLSFSPFLSTDLGQIKVSFIELFQNPLLTCDVIILPGLSAYIGADILSGIYATELNDMEGNYLFIDIGTNGELVLKAKGKMVSAATAAGPAFEGANITFGMGSYEGAIRSAQDYEGHIKLNVIGQGIAKGICGSGLIDLMAICLNRGLVDETGRIINGQSIPVTMGNEGIVLYQSDIRELQLAKAAIAAGIEVLLLECDCTVDELDGLFLAGGFGHHLNMESAIRIGLIPEGLKNKTRIVGNSALAGSVRYLLERNAEESLKQLAHGCKYIELSNNIMFYDKYIEGMNF